MFTNKLKTLTQKTLRRWLLLFFVTLLIPTGLLVQQSYSRLKWETFHQHQQVAQALTSRIDNRLIELINKEDQRPFTDYTFLNVAGDIKANFLQRSPLSNYPVTSDIPGLLGYFQVDDLGALNTPLLPQSSAERYGISAQELAERVALSDQITSILVTNKLINQAQQPSGQSTMLNDSAATVADDSIQSANIKQDYQPQIAFERLSKETPSQRSSKLGRVEDLQLEQAFEAETQAIEAQAFEQQASRRFKKETTQKQVAQARNEKIALPEISANYSSTAGGVFSSSKQVASAVVEPTIKQLRIRTFESEIDPFEFSQLDSGHFVLFRKVWLNGQRYVQGLLIEESAFTVSLMSTPFSKTALSSMSDLLVAYQGNILTDSANNNAVAGEQLYRARLSAPFGGIELIYRITQLPVGAGGQVVLWLGFILASVLLGGFYLMYRLGLGQIRLANQQQDFVSAVSHELKTPLTSIRMYGEMLREGWAPEEKKRQYYDFIFDESERLSRLINNVLQLARMTRNSQQAKLAEHDVTFIMHELKSKTNSQVNRAGFKLTLVCDESVKNKALMVDMDWLTQVIINLVDNAVKFSMHSERKEVVLSCTEGKDKRVAIAVRDFGSGIESQQMKQVFELFYRSESELTRETTGTGIGLSLVQQMVTNMKGNITVKNVNPGARFTISFPPR